MSVSRRLLACVALAGLLHGCNAQFYCWYPAEPRTNEPKCLGLAQCVDFNNNQCNKGKEPENSAENDTGSSFIIECYGGSFDMYFFKDSWKCTEPVDSTRKAHIDASTETCVSVGDSQSNENRLGMYVECEGSAAGCLSSHSTTSRLDPATSEPTAVALEDLRVGDMVESFDIKTNQRVFTEVFLVQHEDQYSRHPIQRIVYQTSEGQASIRATANHYLYGPSGKVLAGDLTAGSQISVVSKDGQQATATVVEVEQVYEPIRNVHTMNDRLVVDGVLVSSFAEVKLFGLNIGENPALIAPLKLLYRLRLLSTVSTIDAWMSAFHRAIALRKPHSLPL